MTDPATDPERLGAIDVGSNSIRLLVADWDPNTGLTIIDEEKAQPRLAAGLSRTGTLDPDAMEEAFEALRLMVGVAERRGVTRLAAVATSAIRDASNGPAFAERVRRELGLGLQIISADHEARLSWRSVRHHFRLEETRAVVADIGGGSVELVCAVDGLVELTASLPLGAVRLTEQGGDHADPRKAVNAMRKEARRVLKRAIPWGDWRQTLVIGSGGSFTNLARMAAARRGQPTDPIHGTTVSTGEVEALLEWLSTMSRDGRAAVPGLNPMRADIILAGLAVTAELLSRLDAREVTASAYGLREGLLLEMVSGDQADDAPSDPLAPLREFVDRCRGDRGHVEHVRLLALALHERLGHLLGCTPEERWLLEAAALLHDVGQLVSYRKHHRHSYQLIMHAERLGLGARERHLVALISRYHRKRGPSRRDPEYAELEPADRKIVRRLAGLLRVADGLDRGHTAAVDRLTVTIIEDQCVIRAYPRIPGADLSLEIWGANRKRDVLERALGMEIVLADGVPTGP